MDPKKVSSTVGGSGVPVSLRFSFDEQGTLAASVYVPDMSLTKHFVDYIIPIYTFIQQIAATLLGRKLGKFYVISDMVRYDEAEFNKSSAPKLKELENFNYVETKTFDLRYLDFAIQHAFDFFSRVKKGDVFIENPFIKTDGHLEVFSDYCEAFRYSEVVNKNLSWQGEPSIKHPQLFYYYDF